MANTSEPFLLLSLCCGQTRRIFTLQIFAPATRPSVHMPLLYSNVKRPSVVDSIR